MTDKSSKSALMSKDYAPVPNSPAKVSMDSISNETALSTADKNNNPDFTRRPNESFGPARKLTPYEMIMTSPLRKSGPRTSSHTHTNTGTATKTSKPTTAYSLSESQPAPTADGKAIARSNPPSCPPPTKMPTNEGILHCGDITCPFAAPAHIKVRNILLQLRTSIRKAIKCEPSLQNKRWYKTHYQVWIQKGLLQNFNNIKNLEIITCWPTPSHPNPTYEGILKNIETIIPSKYLHPPPKFHHNAPIIKISAAAASQITSPPTPHRIGTKAAPTATVSPFSPKVSSHFIITSTSEIGILDEIDEMIREDQESILAQEYEENYKLQLSDKNFHENEKSLHLFSEKFELNLLRLEYIGLDNDEIPFPFRQHIAAANAAAIQSKTLTQQPQRQHQLESKLPSPSASLSTSPSDEPTDLPSLTPSGTPSLSPYIDFSDVPYKVLSVTPNTPKVSSPPHDTVSSTSPKPSSSENAVFDKDNPSINKINSVSSSSSIDETNTASSYSSHDDNNNHNTDHSSSPSYYTNKENAVFDDDDPFPVHIYSSLSSSNFTTKENNENATFEDDDPTNDSHSFAISPSISSSLCEYHHHFT